MIYNSQVGSYAYPTNGIRPHAVTQAGADSYQYDANGNMITRNGTSFVYDYDNRLTSIGGHFFVYDYAGQRAKRDSIVYIGDLYECAGSCGAGTGMKYIFAGSKQIALKTCSTANYYHTDHLGSTNVVTNASGAKVEEIHYYPYGGIRTDTGGVVRHKYTVRKGTSRRGFTITAPDTTIQPSAGSSVRIR